MRALYLSAILIAACGSSHHPEPEPPDPVQKEPPADPARPPATATPIADAYRETATTILAEAQQDDAAWQRLRELTDRIGNRLSGSKALDKAIAWAQEQMKADGQDVRVEKVMVPHWVRGAESAKLIAPVARDLVILGLGGTVGTPKKGITAPVAVVTDWADLEAKKDSLKGKIVLYDVEMPAWTEDGGTHYGDVVPYRWAGPSQAAARGAVAVLMRSVTARSLRTPHTGSMGYDEKLPKIPAAAVSVEDAELIHRLIDAGEEVKVTLKLGAKTLPDVESGNVIGELRGSTNPDEVVVLGAHIDSWDVGQGAHDDGAGVCAVMEALDLLRRTGLTPKRTVRVVLFTNEENGLRGAKAYAEAHQAEIANHVLAVEMDLGGFAPWGFDVDDGIEADKRTDDNHGRLDRMQARMADILTLLEPLGATRHDAGGAGSDVQPLTEAGVPGLGLATDSRTYFDYHHTEADTLDKVDPVDLAKDVAALAVIAYVVGDMPDRLDAE